MIGNLVRRFGALVVLLALVGGAPVLLWILGRGLLPDQVPSLSQAWHALTSQDSGGLFLGALVVVGGLAWLVFTLCVLTELVARLAHRPAFRLPGLRVPQTVAAGLIGVILAGAVSMGATSSNSGMVKALPQLPQAPAASVAGWDPNGARLHSFNDSAGATADAGRLAVTPSALPALPAGSAASASSSVAAAPVWVVEKGDTLWSISEQTTGDPLRYEEIVQLNLGVPQTDGRSLSSGDWLEIGWRLTLPSDAVLPPSKALPAVIAAHPAYDIVVQRGDTLWDLADQHLGDPLRYPELVSANNIADPDLILIGQVLTIPAEAGSVPAETVTQPPGQPKPIIVAPPTAPPGTDAGVEADPGNEATSTVEMPPDDFNHLLPDTHLEKAAASSDTGNAAAALAFSGLSALAAAAIWAGFAAARRRPRRQSSPSARQDGRLDDRSQEHLRARGREVNIAWFDLVLRRLTIGLATEGLPAPAVLTAVVDSSGLFLNLATPAVAPYPFRSDGLRWMLPADSESLGDTATLMGWAAPLPALISCGSDSGKTVLLDLEQLGSIVVTGDPDARRKYLNHLAVELAHSSWSDELQVTVVGWGAELPALNPQRIHYLPDARQAVGELRRHLQQVRDSIADRGQDIVQHRIADPDDGLWAPRVLLIDAARVDPAALADIDSLAGELAAADRLAAAVVISSNWPMPSIPVALNLQPNGTLRLPVILGGPAEVLTAPSMTDPELRAVLAGLSTGAGYEDDLNPAGSTANGREERSWPSSAAATRE